MIDFNFQWDGIELDYDRRYSCNESGCDMICRCSEIVNQKIVSINYSNLVEAVYNYYFDKSLSTERDIKLNSVLHGITKEIDLYTIDRITRHFKLWDKSNWDINIENGFYGQEIDSVTIDTRLYLN
jgi:hypothetical protein